MTAGPWLGTKVGFFKHAHTGEEIALYDIFAKNGGTPVARAVRLEDAPTIAKAPEAVALLRRALAAIKNMDDALNGHVEMSLIDEIDAVLADIPETG